MSIMATLSQNQVEKLLNIIEEIERCLLEARSILSMNASTRPAQEPSQQKTPSIEYIKWRVKNSSSAIPNDEFAFNTQDSDGKVSSDKVPIVDYIKQKGLFQADGYELTLSKDAKFLQRKKV
jgi:hypothetical protein